jgi:hypothetical protein
MKGKGLALIFGKPSSSSKNGEDEGYEDDDEMIEEDEENEDFDEAVDELIAAFDEKDSDAIKKSLKKAIKSCKGY